MPRRQRVGRQRRHLDLQIDPIQQRPGDARPVACDLIGGAATFAARMAEVAAGAGIHRRNELKSCRKGRLARGPRDMNFPRLERLAQHLEHLAIPLGELVEKQYSVMRQRDLARPRIASAADERDRRRRVMRRPIGTTPPVLVAKASGQRLYGGRLESFAFGQRWQQPRKPLRKHRFPGSRRP